MSTVIDSIERRRAVAESYLLGIFFELLGPRPALFRPPLAGGTEQGAGRAVRKRSRVSTIPQPRGDARCCRLRCSFGEKKPPEPDAAPSAGPSSTTCAAASARRRGSPSGAGA